MSYQGFSRQENKHDEVNFDLKRMTDALQGERFTMPEGLTRAEFREWMRENARRCHSK